MSFTGAQEDVLPISDRTRHTQWRAGCVEQVGARLSCVCDARPRNQKQCGQERCTSSRSSEVAQDFHTIPYLKELGSYNSNGASLAVFRWVTDSGFEPEFQRGNAVRDKIDRRDLRRQQLPRVYSVSPAPVITGAPISKNIGIVVVFPSYEMPIADHFETDGFEFELNVCRFGRRTL